MINKKICLFFTVAVLFLTGVVNAQTTAFTYQGRLTDGVSAANGTYEMQFRLFDALSAGSQVGSTITNNSVTVTAGIFTVNLDFGSSPFAAGANRWLEIGVRKASDPPGFTILAPRQQLTSSPYSLYTLSAASANTLSAACVGCVTDAQINSVAGSKITGAVGNATNATNATTATTAGNVTGTVAVANGGTGATTAANARTNLGLGSLSTLTPGGTANGSTFLRGDNTWAAAGGGSDVYFNSVNTSLSTPVFHPISAGANGAVYAVAALIMPQACTLGSLYVNATPTSANPAADTITVTLFKNNVATALAVTVTTSTTVNTSVTGSDLVDTVAVAAGDTVAFQVTQSNTAPVIRLNTSIRCQ